MGSLACGIARLLGFWGGFCGWHGFDAGLCQKIQEVLIHDGFHKVSIHLVYPCWRN
jgi:hypothetical protein